jgi:hypothetical protein
MECAMQLPACKRPYTIQAAGAFKLRQWEVDDLAHLTGLVHLNSWADTSRSTINFEE